MRCGASPRLVFVSESVRVERSLCTLCDCVSVCYVSNFPYENAKDRTPSRKPATAEPSAARRRAAGTLSHFSAVPHPPPAGGTAHVIISKSPWRGSRDPIPGPRGRIPVYTLAIQRAVPGRITIALGVSRSAISGYMRLYLLLVVVPAATRTTGYPQP